MGPHQKTKEKMMILKMYTVRDSKSEIYNAPFFQKTHGEAERSFRQMCNDEKTMPAKYPEDFDLWYLGEYDDNNGKIETIDTPQHVIKGVECVKKTNVENLGNLKTKS